MILGLLYFMAMAFRLVIGFAVAPNHPWFGALIPAFFHLVLASFMMLVGHFHHTGGGSRLDQC